MRKSESIQSVAGKVIYRGGGITFSVFVCLL